MAVAKPRKRNRHSLSEYELSVLERFYEIQPSLTDVALRILKSQLDVPISVIENWYKAKSSKQKRSRTKL